MKLAAFLFLVFFSISTIAQDKVPVPELKNFATDFTNTLEDFELQQLEGKLRALEKKNGAQVVVVIMATTGVETIEEFALKIGENNKIGRKKVDDGVIFLVAKEDRKVRIEVGYGLEGVLTDADCKRIISEIVTPELKQGNFYDGVNAGVDAIIRKIHGSPISPEGTGNFSRPKKSNAFNAYIPAIVVLIIGYFIHFIFGFFLSACFAAFGALLIGPLLMGFGFMQTILLAAILFLVSFVFNLFAGTFIGGNSSSSGGFGGGGGTFGGGGSSGDW